MIEQYLPDIPRAYTALAEWISCTAFIIVFWKKWGITFSKIKSVFISFGTLLVLIIFLISTDSVPIWMWFPCMLLSIFIMFLYIYYLCVLNIRSTMYFTLMAFVTSEFMASFIWQLECNLGKGDPFSLSVYVYLIMIVGYALIANFETLIIQKWMNMDYVISVTYKEVIFAMVIWFLTFVLSNVSFISPSTFLSTNDSVGAFIIRTFVDLCGVAFFSGHLIMCCDWRLQKEYDAIQAVLQNQYVQYQLSKESIEVINMKYHDLKHQIYALQCEENSEKRNLYLEKMKFEIQQYEAQNKTGNQVLDTILTSKSLYCIKKNITLTSVIDGKLLGFMDVSDICNVFGNALDNAIECVEKINDAEKRLIHISVSKQMKFLIILIENYYEEDIDTKLLTTTKKNKEFHGYGIKSIKYTVEKYRGVVEINTKNHWFDMKILIPIK